MIIAAIVATDLNNAIGKNNQLLWHLPTDLKFFKKTTMGCPVIMGRKTYESIGRLLPGRKNSIITRNSNYKIEGAFIFNSIDDALKNLNEEKVFIIGGAEIYNQSLKQTTEVYRTLVKHSFEADTYFPKLENNNFKLVWEECFTADEKNKYDYCFQKWERR
ncbi:MAG: dihydrofolate reductase [Bacteroidota bacterium]|nr:dihydrofolate reductase [Bacteroidota bacterium]